LVIELLIWIRIVIQPKMLDPDPESINPDPETLDRITLQQAITSLVARQMLPDEIRLITLVTL
jgi:hypothetical protein